MFQDNESDILLERNGILISTQKTKHMNSMYFYVKDRLDSKETAIIWCPTDKIVADYLTKPLTGEKLHFFKLGNMNIKELKLEFLRPKSPKSASLNQVGKTERIF